MSLIVCGNYNVVTKNKEVNLNLRVRSDVRDDFKIVAELRGASVSGLIHQFMVKMIREEKDKDPAAFVKFEGQTKVTFDGKVQESDDTNKLRPQQVIEASGELAAAKERNEKKGAA